MPRQTAHPYARLTGFVALALILLPLLFIAVPSSVVVPVQARSQATVTPALPIVSLITPRPNSPIGRPAPAPEARVPLVVTRDRLVPVAVPVPMAPPLAQPETPPVIEQAPAPQPEVPPIVAKKVPPGPQALHQEPGGTYVTVGESQIRYYIDEQGNVTNTILPGIDSTVEGEFIPLPTEAPQAIPVQPVPSQSSHGYTPRSGYRP